jgi:hypothetical protein
LPLASILYVENIYLLLNTMFDIIIFSQNKEKSNWKFCSVEHNMTHADILLFHVFVTAFLYEWRLMLKYSVWARPYTYMLWLLGLEDFYSSLCSIFQGWFVLQNSFSCQGHIIYSNLKLD